MRKLLLFVVVLLVSTPAWAQLPGPYQNDASSYDIVSGCTNVDSCMGLSTRGGTRVQTCKRSICWFCDYHAGRIPQRQCGSTNVQDGATLGCDCGADAQGECQLRNGTCSII